MRGIGSCISPRPTHIARGFPGTRFRTTALYKDRDWIRTGRNDAHLAAEGTLDALARRVVEHSQIAVATRVLTVKPDDHTWPPMHRCRIGARAYTCGNWIWI